MMRLLGKDVAVMQCSNPLLVGVHGTLALESMHMITIVSEAKKISVAKTGTVLQVQESGRLVVGDDMEGRIEDRLSRGAKA